MHNEVYNSLQPLSLPSDGVGECRGTHRQHKKPNSLPLEKTLYSRYWVYKLESRRASGDTLPLSEVV